MLDLMLDCCFLAKSANIKDLANEAEGVKILCSRKDVRACSVLSNSCTTCKVRYLCYSHYYQDSYTGDRAWRRVHILRTRMEYGNMLRRFDCNLQHLWRCTPCKVRNPCYSQCYKDSYTGDSLATCTHLENVDGICYEELTATWRRTTKR